MGASASPCRPEPKIPPVDPLAAALSRLLAARMYLRKQSNLGQYRVGHFRVVSPAAMVKVHHGEDRDRGMQVL